jgi:hypothetical protein
MLNAKADQAELDRVDTTKVSKHEIISLLPNEDEQQEKSREFIQSELMHMNNKL